MSKIYFQPLHIKFGLLKMSVTAMDRESVRFAYLSKHVPKSVRPRWKKEYLKTKTLVQNQTTEIRAWNAFEKVCGNFLRNEKEENYTEIVRSKFYHILLCGLTYHWNFIFCIPIWIFFLGCEAAVSDEHGERFHPGISQIYKGYSGKWSPNTLADHCWRLTRHQLANIRGKRRRSECLMNFF